MRAAPGKVLLDVEEVKASDLIIMNPSDKKKDHKFTVADCNCDWLKVGDVVILYNHAAVQAVDPEGKQGVVHENDIWAIK